MQYTKYVSIGLKKDKKIRKSKIYYRYIDRTTLLALPVNKIFNHFRQPKGELLYVLTTCNHLAYFL